MDGLQFTKAWLRRNAEKLAQAKEAACMSPPAADDPTTSETTPSSPQQTPNLILNTAFLEILDWDDSNIYPEVKSHFELYHCFTDHLSRHTVMFLVNYKPRFLHENQYVGVFHEAIVQDLVMINNYFSCH